MLLMQIKGGREEIMDHLRQEGKRAIKETEANANAEICQSEK